MNYDVRISKGYDKQWSAKTSIDFGVPNMKLKVSTFKSLRGTLYTSCQAVKIEGGFESFIICGDYSKTIKTFPEIKRVSDKVIEVAHKEALALIEPFISEAKAFYAKVN